MEDNERKKLDREVKIDIKLKIVPTINGKSIEEAKTFLNKISELVNEFNDDIEVDKL